MAESFRTTVVTILGERYPIKSDADAAYLHELAHYVEEKISSISARAKLPAPLRHEVLASLLIADEFFSEKKKNKEIEQKLDELSGLLAGGLSAPADECAAG